MNLLGKKLLMSARKPRLPTEYQEVEYLEGHGSEYIALDFPLEFGLTYRFNIKFLSNYDPVDVTSAAPSIFGLAERDPRKVVFFRVGKGGGRLYAIMMASNSVSTATPTAYSSTPFNLLTVTRTTDGYDISLDNSHLVAKDAEPWFSPTVSYPFIFAQNSYGSPSRILGEGVGIHEVKISNKFYGISCYRKSDNKPGMYDLVNSTFYTNAGTGEFDVGADVK